MGWEVESEGKGRGGKREEGRKKRGELDVSSEQGRQLSNGRGNRLDSLATGRRTQLTITITDSATTMKS